MRPESSDKNENEFSRYEKSLVAEQPGFVILIVGVVFSIFVSLAIRAGISQDKILFLVDSALVNIDSRFQAKVSAARISLSRGSIPEIAIVVSGLVIENRDVCWGRPILEVDEIRLPVRFWNLIQGDVVVRDVIANDTSLSIRNEISNCKENVSSPRIEHTKNGLVESDTAAHILTDTITKIPKERIKMETILFKKLAVHYLPKAFTSVNIENFAIDIKSENKQKINATGVLILAGETLSGDYSSRAYIDLNLDENVSPNWVGKFNGTWREGHYELGLEFSPNDFNYLFDVKMSHIPLNQLLPLLRKYRFLRTDYNGKQIWLTLAGAAKGNLNNINESSAIIEDMKVEGNVGEIEVKSVKIEKFEPLSYQPFQIEVVSLNLDQLLNFLNRPHPTAAFGQLGVFHGHAEFKNQRDLVIKGEQTGLELVFSNKGIRQVQAISLIAGELSFQNDKWDLRVDRIKPTDGIFLGKVNVEMDKAWEKISIRSKLDDLTLSPSVQRLMTTGGEVGSLSGEVFAKFSLGELVDIRGAISSPEMTIDQLVIKQSRVNFATRANDVWLDIQIQFIKLPEASPAYGFIKNIISENDSVDKIEISKLNVKAKTKKLKDLHWQDLTMTVNQDQVRIRGKWDEDGELRGGIDVSGRKGNKKFEISGHRDRPKVTKK